MKKATLIFSLMLLITAGVAAAVSLNNYPAPFLSEGGFNAQIIVGSNAPATDTLAASDIAVALQQVSSARISAGLEDEYDPSKNSILIGLPCQNSVLAAALGTSACDFGLAEGQGYLKILEKDNRTVLIISGKTAADTRRAARALANYKNYALTGTDVVVTGTLDEPFTKTLEEPLEIESSPATPATTQGSQGKACVTDADCAEDKWCLVEVCRDLGCPEGTTARNHDCVKEAKPATAAKAGQPAAETAKEPPKAEKNGFFARILGFFRSIFSRK